MDRGELILGSLENSYDYTKRVAQAIVEISEERIKQLGKNYSVLGKAGLAFDYAFGKLCSIEREEYLLWQQIERNDGKIPIIDSKKVSWADGEGKIRIDKSIRGSDVYLVAQIADMRPKEESSQNLNYILADFFQNKFSGFEIPKTEDLLEPFFQQHNLSVNSINELSKIIDKQFKFDMEADLWNRIGETITFIRTAYETYSLHTTLVPTYFPFTRGDRPTGREAIMAKLLNDLFREAGAEHIVTLDLHAEQERGFGKLPMEHLHILPIMLEYIANNIKRNQEIVFIAPDAGAAKVGQLYANILRTRLGFGHKVRSYTTNEEKGIANYVRLIGDVTDAYVILIDDEITTGTTIDLLLEQIKLGGAKKTLVGVSHAKLVGKAEETFTRHYDNGNGILDVIVAGDTIPHSQKFLDKNPWLKLLDTSKLFAEAIYNIHCYKSLKSMYEQKVKFYETKINGS